MSDVQGKTTKKKDRSKSRTKTKKAKSTKKVANPSNYSVTEETDAKSVEEEPVPELVPESKSRLQQLLSASKARKQSVWENICNDVDAEISEINLILGKLKIPPVNFRKDKIYPVPVFTEEQVLNTKTCLSRIYMDFYIFPYVLESIQSLIAYVNRTRAVHCTAGIFNPLDYIVEYLYHNNPFHTERRKEPTPLSEIPFVAKWLMKYPRPPPPKWLMLSETEAALRIQCWIRQWLARRKVQRLRLERHGNDLAEIVPTKTHLTEYPGEDECHFSSHKIFAPYYNELKGEAEEFLTTHSYHCLLCKRFKIFLQKEDQKRVQKDIVVNKFNNIGPDGEKITLVN